MTKQITTFCDYRIVQQLTVLRYFLNQLWLPIITAALQHLFHCTGEQTVPPVSGAIDDRACPAGNLRAVRLLVLLKSILRDDNMHAPIAIDDLGDLRG